MRVAVTDSGPGMAPEVMARALDPFFTTKKIGEGTGLGLPQAYGFARQSGGTLLLHSGEGEGTTVEIYLPRSSQAIADPARTARDQPRDAAPPATGTLLFVEDDPLVRETVVPALERAGYTVLTAENADQAIAMLDGGTAVDVVFSDIVMPGWLSGIDLAKATRHRFPRVKVVLATGYSEQRVAIPGVRVLRKPYDMAHALSVLTEAVAD